MRSGEALRHSIPTWNGQGSGPGSDSGAARACVWYRAHVRTAQERSARLVM